MLERSMAYLWTREARVVKAMELISRRGQCVGLIIWAYVGAGCTFSVVAERHSSLPESNGVLPGADGIVFLKVHLFHVLRRDEPSSFIDLDHVSSPGLGNKFQWRECLHLRGAVPFAGILRTGDCSVGW